MYRLVNDKGEPILFEKELFEVVDPYEDPTWVKKGPFEDGDYYPPECGQPGFYERWHDGDPLAREVFASVFTKIVPMTSGDARRNLTVHAI